MQLLQNIKQWFVSELKALFTLQQTDRLWHIALLAFVCMAVPLAIGLYFNHLTYSIMVCLGGLVILYMPTADWWQRMQVMVLSSFGFVASFAVGLLFSQNEITRIVSISTFAFIVHSICLYFNFKSPGSTFFILLTSVASYNAASYPLVLPVLSFLTAGTALACLVALIYSIATRGRPIAITTEEKPDYHSVVLEGLLVGVFVAISLSIAYILKLEKPYWVPASCMAVMRGVNTQHVYQRGFQRILGTMVGLGITYLLLMIETTPLALCITIPILQFLSELFVARNYALALAFITPMALLLAEAASGLTLNENTILITRLYDITLGSIVGAVGGYLLYHQQLRAKFKETTPFLELED
jgi:uncharacterized membrane protein YccC